MHLSLSNLAFTGFGYPALRRLPEHIGLELFYEFGTDWLWEQVLKETYEPRLSEKPGRLSLHGPCVSTNLADVEDSRYLSLYSRAIDFAAKKNADFVVVHTNESFKDGDKVRSRELVKARLNELLALAQKQQVRLLIENVGLKVKETLLFDWSEYLELLLSLPQAGALLDTGHAYLNRWNIPEVIQCLGPRLGAVHLHDNLGVFDDHLPVGCGNLDWHPVFDSIREFAPETTLVFEYANSDMDETLANIAMTCEWYLK
jgi:sugar phosphate isomerase/epimerase